MNNKNDELELKKKFFFKITVLSRILPIIATISLFILTLYDFNEYYDIIIRDEYHYLFDPVGSFLAFIYNISLFFIIVIRLISFIFEKAVLKESKRSVKFKINFFNKSYNIIRNIIINKIIMKNTKELNNLKKRANVMSFGIFFTIFFIISIKTTLVIIGIIVLPIFNYLILVSAYIVMALFFINYIIYNIKFFKNLVKFQVN